MKNAFIALVLISFLPAFVSSSVIHVPSAGSGEATWYSALTNSDMTSIFGEWEMLTFSWNE